MSLRTKLFASFSTFLLSIATNASAAPDKSDTAGQRTFAITNFQSVEVRTWAKIEITQGAAYSVVAIGTPSVLDELLLEGKDGSLLVSHKETRSGIRWNGNVLVRVTLPDLKKIGFKGSGTIAFQNIIKGKSLDIAVSGSGKVTGKVEFEKISLEIHGSGDVNLDGSAHQLSASVKGSGDIMAEKLKAKEADLSVSGSGNIRATVSEKVKAVITGSGDISIYGQPKVVDKEVRGSGSIKLK